MERIEQLLNTHRSLLHQTQVLEDKQFSLLYDQVLDALLAADSPGFWELARLKRMQRFFAKALFHKSLEQRYLDTTKCGFRA